MSYILSSDWHCHAWSQFSKVEDTGINSRLAHILDEIERQAILAQTQGIKRIYVAGDIFHVRGSIKPTVFNPVANMLSHCVNNYGVEIVLMPGNHDLESAETDELSSAISSLDAIPGVTVVSELTVFERDAVVMVPWHNTREGLLAAIDCIDMERREQFDLILHTGINGVIIGMPDHGWAPEELAELGFNRVFCGHYHHHKVFEPNPMKYGDAKIVSIGATTHQTWSDVDTAAGFLVVNDNDFQFVESQAPQFRDFTAFVDAEDANGHFVRVRGIELDEAEIRDMRESLMDAGAKGVIIDPLVKSDVTRPSGASAEGVSIEAQIGAYSAENFGGIAKEIENQAVAVLSEVRSVK